MPIVSLSPTFFSVCSVAYKCLLTKYIANRLLKTSAFKMASDYNQTVEEIANKCRQLAPPLTNDKYKGQAGRIGVFGGCLEYTGAPYFGAISSLKVGADLVRVFCMKEAAPVIKSYSPELMVHPYLDDPAALELIEPWLDRLHAVLIGPGLGRDPAILNTIRDIIVLCRAKAKPLVIDADGLFLLSQNPDAIKDYPSPGVILTPNKREFANLLHLGPDAAPGEVTDRVSAFLSSAGHVTILCKGAEDEIRNAKHKASVSGGGSGRRCGGQGDVLAGSLTTFFYWAVQQESELAVPHDEGAVIASYAACRLVRECNARAFKKKGRSMVASDMIEEIHPVFSEYFETGL